MLVLVFSAALGLLPGAVQAHGGVVEEDDICRIKVEFLSAHFKIYQSTEAGHKQYCEDLPAAAESVFVMEYEHAALASMPIDFRIVRDVTGKGRFARLEDVQEIDDIDAVTVFYRPPAIEPFVYTVLHRFAEEGEFIGVVSALNTETGKRYSAVFPFEVGFSGFGYWPIILILLLLVQLQYLGMTGKLKSWLRPPAATIFVMLGLLFESPADAQSTATFEPVGGEIPLNRMHAWIVFLIDDDGKPIEAATIKVSGGMPAHDHGLATEPRVTAELGDGRYRIDGLRFHMRGEWQLLLSVTTESGTVDILIPFTV